MFWSWVRFKPKQGSHEEKKQRKSSEVICRMIKYPGIQTGGLHKALFVFYVYKWTVNGTLLAHKEWADQVRGNGSVQQCDRQQTLLLKWAADGEDGWYDMTMKVKTLVFVDEEMSVLRYLDILQWSDSQIQVCKNESAELKKWIDRTSPFWGFSDQTSLCTMMCHCIVLRNEAQNRRPWQ